MAEGVLVNVFLVFEQERRWQRLLVIAVLVIDGE